MQEVTVRLRFVRECLGSAKRTKRKGQIVFCFARDHRDRIMFVPTMWANLMQYAAKVANRAYDLVRRIDWSPVIDGKPRPDWQRTVVAAHDDPRNRKRYAVHEAFPPGSVIGVNAVLPHGLSIDEFTELLNLAGSYRGISPFRADSENYGTFEVLSVMPTVRTMESEKSV